MELTGAATRSPSQTDFESEALRFLPSVARFARLLTRDVVDAEDLTQETFLRAYQHWSAFRPGSDCRKWLFAIFFRARRLLQESLLEHARDRGFSVIDHGTNQRARAPEETTACR